MFLSVFLRRLYICLASLALLVLAGLWLVPREDISVHDTRSPAFDLAEFFDGNSVAYGISKIVLAISGSNSVLRFRPAGPGTG
jgi:hypothetical protein